MPAPGPAGAADAHHHRPALAAEQPFRQQVVGLGVLVGAALWLYFSILLYLVEYFRLHDGRDGVLNADRILVGVDTDVLLIFQN